MPITALVHLATMRGTIHTTDPSNSIRRFSRLALVGILLTLVPAPRATADELSPPPTTSSDPTMQCGSDPNPTGCDPGVSVWGSVWVSGLVKNALGIGIEAATVTGGDGPSQTDSLGYYITRVYYSSNQPHFTLTASKPGYESRAKRVSVWEASVGNIDFSLPYALTPTLTPSVFNSSQDRTLSLEIRTAAPGDSTEVWLQLETGGIQSLIHTGTESGLELWTTSIAVSQGAPDGIRNLKVCSVRSGSTGNCDALTIGTKASASVPISYTVDSTPPSITNPSPRPNHNTLLRQPWINAWVSDPLSGINWSTVYISLTHPDGSTSSASGAYFFPSSALALGVHTATVSAADLVGNAATSTWQFNVTTLEASAALGRLEEQTVDVNPDGTVLGAPTTVTFTNVRVDLDPYSINLGPSPYTGAGPVRRNVSLTGATVMFTNESGLPEARGAELQSIDFRADIALLFPESSQSVARMPASSSIITSVTVVVPTGYNTPGSTATLKMEPVPASGLLLDAADPLVQLVPTGGDPLLVSVSTQNIARIDEATGTVVGVSGFEGTLYTYALINNRRHELLHQNTGQSSLPGTSLPDDPYANDPTVKCNGGVDSKRLCVYEGGPTIYNRAYSFEFRKAGFAGYANHWIFRDKTQPTYLAWHQVRTVVDQAATCVNKISARSEILEATTTTRQLLVDPGTRRSNWKITGTAYSDQGVSDPTNPGMLKSDPELIWGSHSLGKTALYSSDANATPVSPDNQALGPVSTSLTLKPKTGVRLLVPQQMVLGARYELDLDAIVTNALEVVSNNYWQFWLSRDAC